MAMNRRTVSYVGGTYLPNRYEEDLASNDPRVTQFYDPRVNVYTSGPGLHLPSHQQPYNIRYQLVFIRIANDRY